MDVTFWVTIIYSPIKLEKTLRDECNADYESIFYVLDSTNGFPTQLIQETPLVYSVIIYSSQVDADSNRIYAKEPCVEPNVIKPESIFIDGSTSKKGFKPVYKIRTCNHRVEQGLAKQTEITTTCEAENHY